MPLAVPPPPTTLTDDEVLARARQAKNGAHFSRLWGGDCIGYASASEADLALCSLLAFWVGGDPGRIEALFGQSALGQREKWVDRPDYRQRTIAEALARQTEFHRPAGQVGVLTRGTMTTQEEAGLQTTVGHHLDGHRGGELSEAEVRQAMGMARDLARTHSSLPDWEATFHLARRLRQLSTDEPKQFEQAAAAFCEQTGRPFEEFWTRFLVCWPKVRLTEGEDIVAVAVSLAGRHPYPPAGRALPRYAAVASIAWHLSQLTGGRFWLPRQQLGVLLKTRPTTISDIVTLLERDGIVRCVDEDYSFVKKKAKVYEFTGPAVAALDEVAA